MEKNKFILLAVGILLTAAFTISCSGDRDEEEFSSSSSNNIEGNSSNDGNLSSSSNEVTSNEVTKVYKLEKGNGYFTYIDEPKGYDCEEGGIVKPETEGWRETVRYSIDNNTMIWNYDAFLNDSLNFSGTSTELTGTWTRTPNKYASCYKAEDGYINCKFDWNITKLYFTETTVEITKNECITDYMENGQITGGLKINIIDCITLEYSKGSEKVTIKTTKTGYSFIYKGNVCEQNTDFTESQYGAACKKAWNNYGEIDYNWTDYVGEFLSDDVKECLFEKNLPKSFFYSSTSE